jgi:hypothetical protein
MDSWRIIDVGINMGRKDLMKHGFMKDYCYCTNDGIEFQVHNIEEMVCNIERYDNDD